MKNIVTYMRTEYMINKNHKILWRIYVNVKIVKTEYVLMK